MIIKKNKVFNPKYGGNRGFSLIEMLLVLTMVAIVYLFTSPYTLKFYQTQLVEGARSDLMDALVRARHNAVLQRNDSDFGVTLSEIEDSYVIFQGSSYGSRETNQDEVFPVIANIAFTGLTDVVFSKMTGLPSVSGSIFVNFDNISKEILINESGSISKAN